MKEYCHRGELRVMIWPLVLAAENKMKVLHILNELKHSGAEVRLQLAYERFERSGIESHILSSGTQIGDYGAILLQSGYGVHHIPFRSNPGFLIDLRNLRKKREIHCSPYSYGESIHLVCTHGKTLWCSHHRKDFLQRLFIFIVFGLEETPGLPKTFKQGLPHCAHGHQ